MIVRNWMKADPLIVASDMLVSDANRILGESNLHGLPVVDDGRLRGLVTRANLLRMDHFILATQDADELDYFNTRLRVRDVMVRNPATVQANDTMVSCLLRGQALGVAQFPVLDGTRVVGLISANEIFQLASHCLGAWERRNGLTLAPGGTGPGRARAHRRRGRGGRRGAAGPVPDRASTRRPGLRAARQEGHHPLSRQAASRRGGGPRSRRIRGA